MTTGAVIDFDLHKLGWRAFEDLVGVIAREILGQTVQVFADGRDGGRDGAFEGQWANGSSDAWSHLNGKIVIQCKFSKKSHAAITLATLSDELKKLQKLAKENRCDSYLLITNYSVAAGMASQIEDEARKKGAKAALVLGKDWINQTISGSEKLRRFVPRVYGLGDVSLIFDERARSQSDALLADLKPRLERFVLTATYERAAAALNEKRIIVLLGEPAVGKTLMAATLTLAALDEFSSTPFKVNSATEFRRHWNTNEPRTFWIDDAFGATRLDEERAHDWENNFQAVTSAVAQGNRVILTSRSHLYIRAIELMKDSTRTELGNRTVEIRVDSLTDRERSQMLYNHIRYGDQPKKFKTALKPYLNGLASIKSLKPEIARRLGSTVFTTDLVVSETGLRTFVEEPMGFLIGVIRELDSSSKAAVAAIFVSRGRLNSPVDSVNQSEFSFVLNRYEVTKAELASALESMRGTVVRLVTDEASPYWTYFHPTIGEAFEQFVQQDPELLGLLVRGVSAQTIVSSFDCNPVRKASNKLSYRNYVRVPPALHDVVIDQLAILENRAPGAIFSTSSFGIGFQFQYVPFLEDRVSDAMLREISSQDTNLVEDLTTIAEESRSSRVERLISRIGQLRRLSESERNRVARVLDSRARRYLDTEWAYGGPLFDLLDPAEQVRLRTQVLDDLASTLARIAAEAYKRWQPTEDPEDEFNSLLGNLDDLANLEDLPDALGELIESARSDVEDNLSIAQEEFAPEPDEDDYEPFSKMEPGGFAPPTERDVFDDVDAD
ncbi:restriction endonuclease [Curtobacterium flaccumfaciens]|uniref:nSTAND3 domain-containing NTPase n=1 Tax=Curtobacterium flaccumfaciens TaxID=2035 RepID=UPI001E4CAA57|nr:restriction endonuclease [Curtobacterium allii]MCE0456098.1 restriction endonuclease [Curtobacterium allii]